MKTLSSLDKNGLWYLRRVVLAIVSWVRSSVALFFCYLCEIIYRQWLNLLHNNQLYRQLSICLISMCRPRSLTHSRRWSLSIWLIKWSADCAVDCSGCGCCWRWSKYPKEFLGLALLTLQTIKPNHIWCSWRERQWQWQWQSAGQWQR